MELQGRGADMVLIIVGRRRQMALIYLTIFLFAERISGLAQASPIGKAKETGFSLWKGEMWFYSEAEAQAAGLRGQGDKGG